MDQEVYARLAGTQTKVPGSLSAAQVPFAWQVPVGRLAHRDVGPAEGPARHLGSHVGADAVLRLLQSLLGALEQALQPGRAIILRWLEAVVIPADLRSSSPSRCKQCS